MPVQVSLPKVVPDDLTHRQWRILSYIAREWANGSIPTMREIGEKFDIGSPNGAQGHVNALRRKGWLRQADGGCIRLAGKTIDLVTA